MNALRSKDARCGRRGRRCFAIAALGAALGLALLPQGASAAMCSIENVPAATLLLPYFAVDLANPAGRTTLMSVTNASAAPTLAHFTLWTDWGVPSLVFDVYLTGYDVQTLNLRDLFLGREPATAPTGEDPQDRISPKGPLSEDGPFPGCASLPPAVPALDAAHQESLRLAHTGKNAPLYAGCLGADYGDSFARGYVTVDVVTRCSTANPSSAGYFDTVAANDNVLFGRSIDVDPTENFAHAENLVHLEACPRTGGTGRCPLPAGAPTFYGRFRAVSGDDRREPLPTTFLTSYLNGGAFSGGTTLVVWRDAKTPAGTDTRPRACGTRPSWFPLQVSDVTAFDEQENVQDLCFIGDTTIPTGAEPSCFPLQTQEISLQHANVQGDSPTPFSPFGWMYLNLNNSVYLNGVLSRVTQAWVQTVSSASGRFSVGYNAIGIDSACDTAPGGVVLIP